MKIVKFDNGTYGVMRRERNMLQTAIFFDLTNPRHTWEMDERFFIDCQGTEQEAREVLQNLITSYEIMDGYEVVDGEETR